ncbi:hypothetical protein [Phytoactinopolyspora endophytica]|uniref:hypothetical protein n=1 Tax=Phytoactinopolyspora endophytica TaxID=1642495 RepID=UPI00101CDB6D|nr:hypothetical protein [Phytoactinopolyspora endophytica]
MNTSDLSGSLPVELSPRHIGDGTVIDRSAAPMFPGATWYTADDVDATVTYAFPAGALQNVRYLASDLLLDGDELAVFQLALREGADGPEFRLSFGALAQCAARIRVPLEVTDLDTWLLSREGAWLKPICWGERVDLARVDQMTLSLIRNGTGPVRWCMTPFIATVAEPPRLTEPLLPHGPLLDELGQNRLRDWPGRSEHVDDVVSRLRTQLDAAPAQEWPDGFSRWGGWTPAGELPATGYFRTHHDGSRWWLVDPAGFRYWSAGIDCVGSSVQTAYDGLESALTWLPDAAGPYGDVHDTGRRMMNYLGANLIHAFGPDSWRESWATVAVGFLKQCGFTTIGNWSNIEAASAAGFPYVRPLHLTCRRTPMVYRDFPDVFAPEFADDAEEYAQALLSTRDDPALVGYFLMNEPTWGFAEESPAAGMLYTTSTCATRRALRDFLAERYGDDAGLRVAWGPDASLGRVADGQWTSALTDTARRDLEDFSTVMVRRLFDTLSAASSQVDPNHLNLGARYYTVPPDWALEGMTSFDVFSVNCYQERVTAPEFAAVSERLNCPVLIGEWHFGALDVGLPASGIGRVADQEARGQAFRVYTEDAAAQPWCVGVHYFTLYDQSALGRFDGENYNIGFVDVCHQPYQPLVDAARASHARLYQVALGEVPPYDQPPAYLPRLFL